MLLFRIIDERLSYRSFLKVEKNLTELINREQARRGITLSKRRRAKSVRRARKKKKKRN